MSNRLLVKDLSRMGLPKLEDEKQNHTFEAELLKCKTHFSRSLMGGETFQNMLPEVFSLR